MRAARADHTQVVSVTSAARSHTEDIALRQRRYIQTQSLRIVCVVLATALPVPIIYRGLLIVGAVVLPWFGVIMANASSAKSRASQRATAEPEAAVSAPAQVALSSVRVIDAD